jgi:hypothetical protein
MYSDFKQEGGLMMVCEFIRDGSGARYGTKAFGGEFEWQSPLF